MTERDFSTVTPEIDSWHVAGDRYEFWRGEWELKNRECERLHFWLAVQPIAVLLLFAGILWLFGVLS